MFGASDQVHTCSTHGVRVKCKACERESRELKRRCAELSAYDENFVPSNDREREALKRGWNPRLGNCRSMQGCGKCPRCLEYGRRG